MGKENDLTNAAGEKSASHTQKPKVRLFQYGDAKGIEKYDEWIQTVKVFAEKNGWDHSLRNFDVMPPKCADKECDGTMLTLIKPDVILEEMDKMHDEDWLIYLDLDIAIANPEKFLNGFTNAGLQAPKGGVNFGKLQSDETEEGGKIQKERERLASSMKTMSDALSLWQQTCSVVAQGSNHTIQAGFLAFKGPFDEASVSRKFTKLWLGENNRINKVWGNKATNVWVGDQGPLQSAVLKLADPSYDNECENSSLGTPNQKNQCWEMRMDKRGLPHEERSFGKYCILGNAYRWNMHDSDYHYKYGDVLYHGKHFSQKLIGGN